MLARPGICWVQHIVLIRVYIHVSFLILCHKTAVTEKCVLSDGLHAWKADNECHLCQLFVRFLLLRADWD